MGSHSNCTATPPVFLKHVKLFSLKSDMLSFMETRVQLAWRPERSAALRRDDTATTLWSQQAGHHHHCRFLLVWGEEWSHFCFFSALWSLDSQSQTRVMQKRKRERIRKETRVQLFMPPNKQKRKITGTHFSNYPGSGYISFFISLYKCSNSSH